MPDFRSGLFSGLQFRLVLGFTLALAVALVLVGASIGFAADRQTERFENDLHAAQAARVRQLVGEYYANRLDWDAGRSDLQHTLERAGPVSGSRIVVYDAKGTVVADSHASLDKDLPGRDGKKRKYLWKDAKRFPVHHDKEQVGTFSVAALSPIGPEPQDIADPVAAQISAVVNRSLLWAGIGAAALGTLLVWLLSRHTLAPLQSLGAAARRLGRGDLSQRAETEGPSEIRQLAHSFNVMAEGLEEAERHRRNLTADIAHELRTPLSNIQGYLEAIKDGLVQPTPETIDTIHGQALHLSRLVEDLRLLAQVEAGALTLQLSLTRMEELLQSSVEAVRPRAEAKGVNVTLELDPSLPDMELDATRVAQVIGNLLENAITHTPEGGRVAVTARADDGGVEIAVADTGPGIPPEELPRLFDRFYRADPSRARATGGSGLGLTIARRLIEAHGGTIEAHSVLGQGSRFTIHLPAPSSPLP